MSCIWGTSRPNCIILDEIDGAMNGADGRSAISAIVKMVNTPLNSSNKSEHPLIRPIICICNDLFAPVLRPLRKLATVYSMYAPKQIRVVQRLKVVMVFDIAESSNIFT